jgi:hypothetical protein
MFISLVLLLFCLENCFTFAFFMFHVLPISPADDTEKYGDHTAVHPEHCEQLMENTVIDITNV